ncbi:hypothetical protein FGO68_gene3952 [Halteria grandinella]|uniref:Uncharacterized protein n=1 Tax=Halteria grandinella TaxID=5974 RepID=A0A8J8NGY1_HALGN|nr:hypothetical protein FGO68_gene3952 [Halteria grandinella]
MDIEDTFEYSIQFFSNQQNIDSSSIQIVSVEQWDSQFLQNPGTLWLLRKNFFTKYYQQEPKFHNVIIPLLQFQDGDDLNSQLFFLHIFERNRKYECEVFVDQMIGTPDQFSQLIFQFLRSYGFVIELNDIRLQNQKKMQIFCAIQAMDINLLWSSMLTISKANSLGIRKEVNRYKNQYLEIFLHNC